MYFKIKTKFKDIIKFSFSDYLMINDKKIATLTFYDFVNFNAINKINFNEAFLETKKINNNFYGLTSNGDLFLINQDVKKFNTEENSKFYIYLFETPFLFYYNYDKSFNPINFCLYDVENFKTLWKIQSALPRFILLAQNKVIIDNLSNPSSWNIVECYSILSGTLLWQFDTTTIAPKLQVSKLIGVFEDVLVVALENNNLIGLDVSNGKLIWHIEKANNSSYVFNEKEKCLEGIISRLYFRLNYKNGEYKRIEFSKEDPILVSQRDEFVLIGNHIITTDWRKGVIGAFNTQTHQFDWIHEEPGVSFPGGSPIKYFEPYLFLQDNKNTLHIFEKE